MTTSADHSHGEPLPAMEPHGFWQELLPPAPPPARFVDRYPAALPDGRRVLLPLRALPDAPDCAVASLIVNQASFAVEAALITAMAELARGFSAEIVVGLPTLGLSLARGVAKALGHPRYVPLGTSRKFWYRDELSQPLRSITTPGGGKRLYFDPRLLPLVVGRPVLLVDDVTSTGASAAAALALLRDAGAEPVALVVAMTQTERWRARLALPVRGTFATPLLRRDGDDWVVDIRPDDGGAVRAGSF